VELWLREILPAITIVWVDEYTHFAATEAMLTAGNRGPSLVDCSSFAIMDDKGITHAFAYDEHFTVHGYKR
jgi:predicted nucleic acid-binding protein